MAQLIRIGNSQGLRIPKPLIEQAQLEGQELSLEIRVGEGLLIRPVKKVRAGWAEQVQALLDQNGPDSPDSDWLDAPLSTDSGEWE